MILDSSSNPFTSRRWPTTDGYGLGDLLCCVRGEEEHAVPLALDSSSNSLVVSSSHIYDIELPTTLVQPLASPCTWPTTDYNYTCYNRDVEEKNITSPFQTSYLSRMDVPAVHRMGPLPSVRLLPRSEILNSAHHCQWGRLDKHIQFDVSSMRSPSIMRHISRCYWVGESAALGVRLSVMHHCASALSAYHDRNIVYGILTPESVSVTHGRGTLESPCREWSPDNNVDSARWAATELVLMDDDRLPTKMSDVYSFGCLMLQVLTGSVPYCAARRPEQVVYLKYLGREPIDGQISKVADHHVAFLRWCWSREPEDRPTMEAVVGFLLEEIEKLGEQRG